MPSEYLPPGVPDLGGRMWIDHHLPVPGTFIDDYQGFPLVEDEKVTDRASIHAMKKLGDLVPGDSHPQRLWAACQECKAVGFRTVTFFEQLQPDDAMHPKNYCWRCRDAG